MTDQDRTNYCPCGTAWPCRCPAAWKVMGFSKAPTPGDDQDVVITLECPKCGQNVLLEIDPSCVEEAQLIEGRWVVTDAGGPAIGECCGVLFTTQPDGEISSFIIPENDKRNDGDEKKV